MSDTGWRLGHRPSLDALRGVAILLVLLGHVEVIPASAAPLGVSLFFALSGYLITALVLGELADRGAVDFRRFYLRRARRLVPALVVLLAATAALAALRGTIWAWFRGVGPVVLYAGNWGVLAGIVPEDLNHTWSLGIEEQFYLVWPALLLLLARRRWLVPGTAVLICLSAVSILPWYPYMGVNYYGTPQRAGELLAGGLVAVVSMRRGSDLRPSPLATYLSLTALVLLALEPTGGVFGTLLATIPLGVVVAAASSRPDALAWRPLTGTGRISYGLYLYHFPLVGLLPPLAVLASSYAAAGASWVLVERRFLRPRSP